jgi:UDP-glucose 4-epimerase
VRVGVTGGAGFIGGWVCDELVQRGHVPIVFDRVNRCGTHGQVLGDVRDPSAFLSLAAEVDGIIHLAAVLGTQETIPHPDHAVLTNIQGGLNFLAALRRYDLPGVNICVGNHWMNNPYSISKTTVERLCDMARVETGTRVNQVRVVNAYGPRQLAPAPYGTSKVRKIIPTFICQALSGRPVEVYGDGTQVSDCIWVGHVADVLVRSFEAAARGDVFGRVVEVGPAKSVTVGDIAEQVVAITESTAGIKHLSMRPGETTGSPVVADTATLALVGLDAYDFEPLECGLHHTVDWFRAVEGPAWRRC